MSDPNCNQKRPSVEDSVQSLQKVARRNSDLNVKSDSPLIPNISEKINRVDISENMEVTLGNDDISCVSISENISANSSDSEMSRLGGEQSKRKPIQVDIENTELTISPTNKLKISDKLIKRLSDADKNVTANPKIEEVRKNIGKKSPTDILIEKFRNVVDHEVIDFGHASTSSLEDDNESGSSEKCLDPSSTRATISDNVASTLTNCDKAILTESSDNAAKIKNINIENTSEIPNSTDKIADLAANTVGDILKQDDTKKSSTEAELKQPDSSNKEVVTSKDDKSSEELPKKQRVLTQPSITEFTVSSTNSDSCEKSNFGGIETNKNGDLTANSSKSTPQGNKTVHPKVMNIIEEFEDIEEAEAMNDIEIDKNNIFNIIHSSLNEAKSKENGKEDNIVNENSSTTNVKTLNRKRKVSSNENSPSQAKLVKLVPIESILNKSKDKEISGSSLLQKSLQGKKMIRKLSSASSTPTSSVSRQSSMQEIIAEDIKSEPETDDDFSESENLEAKKKYLSALNISEKINDSNKKQQNAIRTRSKTEEKREKFKKLDNLTRIIDDVALNYGVSKDKPILATQKPDVRKSIANPHEGEIFVKSFAKMTPFKPRARKSFPTPTYIKSNIQPKLNSQISLLKKELVPNSATPKKDFPKTNVTTTGTKILLNNAVTTTTASQPQPTTEVASGSVSHVIILPPTQSLSYSSSSANPVLTVVNLLFSKDQ